MEEIYSKNSFFKHSDGNIYRVIVPSCTIDCYRPVDPLISSGLVTPAIKHKTVADEFGVDRGVIRKHGPGLITEDSLLRFLGL